MTKAIITVLMILCFGTNKAQTIYQLTVSNLSKKSFGIDVNRHGSKNVLPSQSFVFVDSTGFDQLSLIKMKMTIENQGAQQVHEIQIVAGNKSKINLEVYEVDSIQYGKGFKLIGLPFPGKQEILVKDFFAKKNEFTAWVKMEYAKTHNRSLSRSQKDSILSDVRLGRKKYLSAIENLIVNHRNSYVTYYIFESELLIPKNILAIGKEKVISIFELLDASYHKTDIGNLAKNYVENLKSNSVGAQIKNFKFKTYNSKEYELHNFIKHSNALLIFTARGCKGCIEQVPIIKEIEKKLYPDIKIVYVSLDPSVDEWKKNMESTHYPGLITLNIPPYNYSIDLERLFMVEFIPQLFLIDENNTILYDNLSPFEDEKLARLKELLNIVED